MTFPKYNTQHTFKAVHRGFFKEFLECLVLHVLMVVESEKQCFQSDFCAVTVFVRDGGLYSGSGVVQGPTFTSG